MADTYSGRPLISHDGPDDNNFRAEVKVVMGFGHVDSIEKSAAGKSAKVSFAVENTKFKSAGWAPVDDKVMKLVETAKESGEPIHFRIETRRQDKIPRETPIAELTDLANAKDSIHKSLAAVKLADDENWTISPFAKTNMAEDPSFGSKSANDYTLEELRKLGGNAPTQASGPSYNGLEPPPYVTYNSKGDLNPGSMAVAVPLNIYTFLTEYFKENSVEVDDKTKFVVVRAVLDVCNKAQMGIYGDELEAPDLSKGSHTRARALVFESIRIFFPLTEEITTDKAALAQWKTDTLDKVLAMWRWSMKEVSALTS